MKDTDFQNLLQGIREAGYYLRGDKKVAARVDRIAPESVSAIRAKLKLSQTEFSTAFGISTATLRNWEQGRLSQNKRHLPAFSKLTENEISRLEAAVAFAYADTTND